MTTGRAGLLSAAVLAAAFVGFFHEVLFRDRQLVDRDTAHFYYPLFWYERQEIRAGRLPLWNPLQNAGEPLAANPAASVFYPPKALIYALPYSPGFKLFLLAHVAWTLAGAYRLGRQLAMSRPASCVVALIFAFNGHVLYQLSNVPFLVSASWLPWYVAALDRTASGRTAPPRGLSGSWDGFQGALVLAFCLAMMLLAGDPQLAYGCVWLSPIYLAVCGTAWPWARRLGRAVLLPAAAAALCLALTAVQVLPAMELEAHSIRAAGQPPDNWWHYSFHPWRTVECFLPWFFGRQWPMHRYWGQALFETTGLWTPSAYMGLVTLLLVIAGFRRRPDRRDALMLLWVAAGLVIAYGKFLPVYEWLIRYWPGAGEFRYPSKHVTWVALGLAVLAGRGLDRQWLWPAVGAAPPRRPWPLLLAALATGVFLQIIRLTGDQDGGFLRAWAHQPVEASPFYGPFDPLGALADLRRCLEHAEALAVAVMVACLLSVWRGWRATGAALVVLLVGLDLGVANHWLVVTHREAVWKTPPLTVQLIRQHQAALGRQAVPTGRQAPFHRLYRPVMLIADLWSQAHEADRLEAIFEHDVARLENKNGLFWDIPQAVSDVTFPLAAFEQFVQSGGQESLDLLGAAYLLLPRRAAPPPGSRELTDSARRPAEPHRAYTVYHEAVPPLQDARLWYRAQAWPRAWMETLDGRRLADVPVQIPFYQSDEVHLRLEHASSGRVILADTFYPGWQATVDGRPVPIERAYTTLRAVPIGPGPHHIVMRYRPMAFTIGLWITIASAAAVLTVWVVKRAWRPRDRRRSGSSPSGGSSPAQPPAPPSGGASPRTGGDSRYC